MLELKAQGVTSIIISHKLNEVRASPTRVTVIRDGATVSTLDANSEGDHRRPDRARHGRPDMEHRFPGAQPRSPGDMLMEVATGTSGIPNMPSAQVIRDASFNVRAGEVVGIAGLMGSGRTELAMSDLRPELRAKASPGGPDRRKPSMSPPSTVPSAGLAYVTEDRKASRACSRRDDPLQHHARQPEGRSSVRRLSRSEEVGSPRATARRWHPHARRFQKVGNLSGGNQQKVVLSKWLFAGPRC
jgi:putative multiple sugar transport system ATP-binding protein